jgi:hypothetical protein
MTLPLRGIRRDSGGKWGKLSLGTVRGVTFSRGCSGCPSQTLSDPLLAWLLRLSLSEERREEREERRGTQWVIA